MTIEKYSETDLPLIAKKLLGAFPDRKVWCFYAEMGSGKTTLIKAICNELRVTDTMSSPTFSIVNEYQTDRFERVYHFDFYRLKNSGEAMDIGVEEYFFSDFYCFCEWPEVIEGLLPDKYLKININLAGDNQRSLIAQPNE